MPSSKKSSPKKSSPKGSPKKSPKKSPKGGGKGGKFNPEMSDRLLPRENYSFMGTIFKKTSPKISLYLNRLHVYELWNFMPEVEQYSNSNKSGSPKRSGSPKGSPKRSGSPKDKKGSPKRKGSPKGGKGEPSPDLPDFEPAKLSGIVVVRKDCVREGTQVFIEVCAEFVYSAQAKVPPFPDEVMTRCQCYREVKVLNTIQVNEDYSDDHNQALFAKIKTKFRKGRAYPFQFDLTRKPDSLFFRRPYHYEYQSGLFWRLRAYVSSAEHCEPAPDLQMNMDFYKYTIAPWSDANKAVLTRPGKSVQYIRHATMDDAGDLILQAQLDKQIYNHGQEIKVKMKIENGSARHVIHSMAIYIEQTCRLNHQLPQDITTPIGDIKLTAGEAGLAINPKNKNWTREVVLRPTFDPTKYNLVVDGKMPIDGKVFLANSTIIMISTPIPPPPPPPEGEQTGDAKGKKGSPGKKKSPSKSPSRSPKSKQSPASKKSPGKSPKKSPGKGKGGKAEVKPPEPEEEVEPVIKFDHVMTSKQDCRPALVFYNVVVRLNLKTPAGDEAGHPSIRLPFLLTRETRFLDKIAKPPTWDIVAKH